MILSEAADFHPRASLVGSRLHTVRAGPQSKGQALPATTSRSATFTEA